MVPVADPVIAKTHSNCVDAEVDALRELMRINIAAVRELINERHERYSERFISQEKAVITASEGQKRYDSTHNDLVRKMEGMIPRNEADQRFIQMRELIESQGKLIGALQLTISRGEGGASVSAERKSQSNWMIALMVGVALSLLGMVITVGFSIYNASKTPIVQPAK